MTTPLPSLDDRFRVGGNLSISPLPRLMERNDSVKNETNMNARRRVPLVSELATSKSHTSTDGGGFKHLAMKSCSGSSFGEQSQPKQEESRRRPWHHHHHQQQQQQQQHLKQQREHGILFRSLESIFTSVASVGETLREEQAASCVAPPPSTSVVAAAAATTDNEDERDCSCDDGEDDEDISLQPPAPSRIGVDGNTMRKFWGRAASTNTIRQHDQDGAASWLASARQQWCHHEASGSGGGGIRKRVTMDMVATSSVAGGSLDIEKLVDVSFGGGGGSRYPRGGERRSYSRSSSIDSLIGSLADEELPRHLASSCPSKLESTPPPSPPPPPTLQTGRSGSRRDSVDSVDSSEPEDIRRRISGGMYVYDADHKLNDMFLDPMFTMVDGIITLVEDDSLMR